MNLIIFEENENKLILYNVESVVGKIFLKAKNTWALEIVGSISNSDLLEKLMVGLETWAPRFRPFSFASSSTKLF